MGFGVAVRARRASGSCRHHLGVVDGLLDGREDLVHGQRAVNLLEGTGRGCRVCSRTAACATRAGMGQPHVARTGHDPTLVQARQQGCRH